MKSRFKITGLLPVLAIGLIAAMAQPIYGQTKIKLAKRAKCKEIVTALGTRLGEVAAKYKKTAAQLTEIANRDNDLWTDTNGQLFYACPPTAAPIAAAAATPTQAGTGALQTYPSAQTFLLHSKAGSTKTIYLDFNGQVTTGTYWNSDYTANNAIVTAAYDTDANTASFSTAEMSAIQEIWKRVSEDYAPWDVDVTTEEPNIEALRKTTATDTTYGIRVCIGGNSNWLGASTGGVAYVDCFTWNTDTPIFVFTANLSNGYPKYVAEAVSHETGHSLGLSHDGQATGLEYYAGHNGWAPIMGTGYSATVTQFSKGEYSLPNNTEDDLAVIDLSITRNVDLAGNDILTAVPLTGTSVAVTGIVDRGPDADLYKVVCGAGVVTLSAVPASPEGNLDITLSLYNGSGGIVTSSNPTGLSANLSISVAAGTYYIAVEGLGTGSGTTAYTDYGSLGQFSLTGTVPSATNQPPVAAVNASVVSGTAPVTVNFTSTGSSDPEGGVLTYDWDFGDGTRSTLASPSKTYSTAGTYVASLVVYDPSGLSASASKTITVTAPNQAPTANITTNLTSGTAPVTVNFSGTTSTDPEGGVLTYAWNFGDGTTSTVASPSKTYSTPGTYTASLTVRDTGSLTGSKSTTITVNAPPVNQAPTANITTNLTSGTAPVTVNFSGTTSTDPEGGVLTYAWNFGDGTTSTVASPSKTYSTAGSYTASLTVRDTGGLTGLKSTTITVNATAVNQAPTANITTNLTSGTAPVTVNFSGSTSTDPESGVLTYAWNFGDGTTSTVVSPSKTYSTAGSYTATLTVRDNDGLTATKSTVITVNTATGATQIYISALTISKEVNATKGTRAKVVVTIKDQANALKANVKVTANWTGLTPATGVTATTTTSGTATFYSNYTKNAGTFTFTATGATLAGFTYTPTRNASSTASIVK